MTRQFLTQASVAGTVAFFASLALTPAAGALARRIGAVAKPKSDRWHTRPTAMLGGVAIVIAVVGTLLALVPSTRESHIVMAASVALFLVGLTDDFFRIKPYQKLIGQLLGAAAVVTFGLVLWEMIGSMSPQAPGWITSGLCSICGRIGHRFPRCIRSLW